MLTVSKGWPLPRNRLPRRGMSAALTLALAMTATACGSDSSDSNTSASSSSESSGSAASSGDAAGVKAAEAAYKAKMGPVTWKAPGPAFDASSAKGKTVAYIGVDMSIPVLQVITGELKAALATAGVTLDICDGKGQPTQWKACADNAVNRKAGAIIVESFPPELIAGSLANAKKAGIPVIDGNNADPTDPLLPNESARVAYPYSESGRLTADWVIADSKGKANVLILATSDVPNSKAVVDNGYEAELKDKCPGCKFTTKDLPVAQWSTNLGPLTQSSLSADPNINYIIPAYDGMSTFVLPAIRQAGKADKVKVATFNADLDPMQNMAKGNMIGVDTGSHNTYEGWAYADQSLRLMTGQPPLKDELVPVRVFTRENVGDLKLDSAAEKSGEWFGDPTFKTEYPKLWGIGG
jgi:ribose transport system substrate-binding protein